METVKSYENYPISTVFITNLFSIIIYGLGFILMMKLGLFFAGCYLIYISALEFRLIRYHCTDCYYYGKTCGFGKGKLSSIFFKKGDGLKFCAHKMTWKDMIPDLLVSLVPIIVGIVYLIINFDLILLAGVLLLIFLTSIGNGFIRGSLTCKYCKQRELGCPAEKLFNKPSA